MVMIEAMACGTPDGPRVRRAYLDHSMRAGEPPDDAAPPGSPRAEPAHDRLAIGEGR